MLEPSTKRGRESMSEHLRSPKRCAHDQGQGSGAVPALACLKNPTIFIKVVSYGKCGRVRARVRVRVRARVRVRVSVRGPSVACWKLSSPACVFVCVCVCVQNYATIIRHHLTGL